MKQITFVALYGEKKKDFKNLIRSIREEIENSELSSIYKPYVMDQIHGTMVGMEKVTGFDKHFNANIWNKEGWKEEMDFANLFSTIDPFFPMNIQFGGFSEDFDGFTSYGGTPYHRTFEINWKSKKIILIGWSLQTETNIADKKLVQLREQLQNRHNLRPKMDKDNDFYMVIGELGDLELLNDDEIAGLKTASKRLEKIIRDKLAGSLQEIRVTMDDLFFVRYQKETLEVDTSEAWNIKSAENNNNFLKDLF